jgi:4-hydroxybenzoate polyprenyltransferase
MVLLMTIATAIFGGSWLSVALVFLASAAGQATVGWTNDVHDAEADRAAGRTTKPTVRGELRPDDLRVPILVSATLTIPLSFFAAGGVGGATHIAAVTSALVYNFLLARTVWSWVPYAVSFALMPVFIVGVTAHVLNAIPDIDIDRETGWGGLAVSLGKSRSVILAAVLVTVGVVCLGVVINDLLLG